VKGLKKKISFVGQFDNLGSKIQINNGIMKIIKRALMVLKVRKIAANLFVLMRETRHEVEASIASASPLEEKMMM
jgi:F0F1-type ATP synthase delta subunit